ncbi:MAG: hypothetical protein PHQ50_01430 [Eubacteriales bacterium]|nr:hypothetical protein [Eubacteriales bacterium]MDD3350006.1 hypothetical protein [Eubacteriales bacterium]
MGKTTEELLEKALQKRDLLLERREKIQVEIKSCDTLIKTLTQKQKEETLTFGIQRIEAAGFTLGDILDALEEKISQEKEMEE